MYTSIRYLSYKSIHAYLQILSQSVHIHIHINKYIDEYIHIYIYIYIYYIYVHLCNGSPSTQDRREELLRSF